MTSCMKKIGCGLFVLLFFLINPAISRAEFYKYVDENGAVHFVDDINKIPVQYRYDLDKYKEKYDDLHPKDKALKLAEERRRAEKLKAEEAAKAAQEAARQRQLARQEMLKRVETKVIINGNQILVPVTMWTGYNKLNTLLLLDTGATVIVLHKKIADQLNLTPIQKGKIRVAGGNVIDSYRGRLSRFAVGPYKVENIGVTVIEHQGPKIDYSGLLGMNFLRNVKYTIDYQNQVIRWQAQ
ncbi:retroviral-like aspartic protease family protein [Desulfococcaceae bacterium HSG9]|nr:retroviral-like aspartic protease family protein [Desulfococcaceae bacterium HSG9]